MAEDVVNRAVNAALQRVQGMMKISGKNGVKVAGQFPQWVVSADPRNEEAVDSRWMVINACHMGVPVRQRILAESMELIEDPEE